MSMIIQMNPILMNIQRNMKNVFIKETSYQKEQFKNYIT